MDKGYSNSRRLIFSILICIPIIAVIVYFKLTAKDAIVEDEEQKLELERDVATPNTSVSAGVLPAVEETITVTVPDSMGTDRRPPMEAGDEDGYWDGWYDGAETGERVRYDESSNFRKAQDRETYAASYKEGYEKGFDEAMAKRDKPLKKEEETEP